MIIFSDFYLKLQEKKISNLVSNCAMLIGMAKKFLCRECLEIEILELQNEEL
jgi:hypothetical protein